MAGRERELISLKTRAIPDTDTRRAILSIPDETPAPAHLKAV